MKVLNYFRVAICAIAVAFACSCEETKEAVITFPEASAVTIANGEEVELTFNAEAAWKLTVDKDWIVFVDNGENFNQLTGAAGSQTITITVIMAIMALFQMRDHANLATFLHNSFFLTRASSLYWYSLS